MCGGLWEFLLWIGVVFIGEELVGFRNKLWAVSFLLFFRDVSVFTMDWSIVYWEGVSWFSQ
jgi:hypothetical protein